MRRAHGRDEVDVGWLRFGLCGAERLDFLFEALNLFGLLFDDGFEVGHPGSLRGCVYRRFGLIGFILLSEARNSSERPHFGFLQSVQVFWRAFESARLLNGEL